MVQAAQASQLEATLLVGDPAAAAPLAWLLGTFSTGHEDAAPTDAAGEPASPACAGRVTATQLVSFGVGLAPMEGG